MTKRRTGIDCIDVIQYIEIRLIQSFCNSRRGRHVFFCQHGNCSVSYVRIRPFNLAYLTLYIILLLLMIFGITQNYTSYKLNYNIINYTSNI
ncbi:Uncharacterized protein FWK35_00034796 [Aphis craccivora]|uniref:Uncharacterized protein n=1 Tax=Aphis craccivora TaxID=307492 RepID=A0A6G0VJW8_APHCR|nr:Uncharacterized protein FWK35_00034796 [Aphis craccivora]